MTEDTKEILDRLDDLKIELEETKKEAADKDHFLIIFLLGLILFHGCK
jgi:hypothetical protein